MKMKNKLTKAQEKIPVNKIVLGGVVVSLTSFVAYMYHPFFGLGWNVAGIGLLTTWIVGKWENA